MRQPNTSLGLLIMDASSSMNGHAESVRSAVNSYLHRVARNAGGRSIYVGVVSFSDEAKVLLQFTEISQARELTRFDTGGCTRLWATVDENLSFLLQQANSFSPLGPVSQDLAVTVAVFSDGDDTHRLPGYPDKLKRTSAQAAAYNWRLLSFGFGYNAKKLAHDMGFPSDWAQTEEASQDGIARTMTATADMTTLPPAYALAGFAGRDIMPLHEEPLPPVKDQPLDASWVSPSSPRDEMGTGNPDDGVHQSMFGGPVGNDHTLPPGYVYQPPEPPPAEHSDGIDHTLMPGDLDECQELPPGFKWPDHPDKSSPPGS